MAVSITVKSASKADELVSRREKMTPLGKPENWLSHPCHCEQSKKLVEMSVTEMSVVFVCSVQTGDLTTSPARAAGRCGYCPDLQMVYEAH